MTPEALQKQVIQSKCPSILLVLGNCLFLKQMFGFNLPLPHPIFGSTVQ